MFWFFWFKKSCVVLCCIVLCCVVLCCIVLCCFELFICFICCACFKWLINPSIQPSIRSSIRSPFHRSFKLTWNCCKGGWSRCLQPCDAVSPWGGQFCYRTIWAPTCCRTPGRRLQRVLWRFVAVAETMERWRLFRAPLWLFTWNVPLILLLLLMMMMMLLKHLRFLISNFKQTTRLFSEFNFATFERSISSQNNLQPRQMRAVARSTVSMFNQLLRNKYFELEKKIIKFNFVSYDNQNKS